MVKTLNQERLDKDDGHDDENRRKIKPAEVHGDEPSNSVENRFRDIVEEPHNGIVRIGAHPRDDGPRNDDPHIDRQPDIENLGNGHEKIRKDKHDDLSLEP